MADGNPKPGNLITRKIGPLPGWAWVGVAGGGTYLWLRHKNAATTSSASDEADSTADEGVDAGLQDSTDGDNAADFAQPYTGAGLYTDLASAQAGEQKDAAGLATEQKKLATYETNHPAGTVNKKTGVYTATAATTLQKLASRFGVTVAQLKKDNPSLKTDKVKKGERIHYEIKPAAKKPPVKKPVPPR